MTQKTEKKAKRAGADKAMRPAEDKLTNDLATLERDANFDDGPSLGADHKITVCYNPACPDYRVERKGDGSCSCKRTKAIAR